VFLEREKRLGFFKFIRICIALGRVFWGGRLVGGGLCRETCEIWSVGGLFRFGMYCRFWRQNDIIKKSNLFQVA